MNNSVALCCIAKQENDYIRDYIDFYFNIGVDHIFIYDHNQEGEDRFEDVINDYIINKTVEIIPWQSHEVKTGVLDAYNDCYTKNKDKYDWICFFDPDEFIWLHEKYNNNIKNYLYQKCFDNLNVICLNWVTYDDNNLIYKDDRPVYKRFTHQVEPPLYFEENKHIKSIIHTSVNLKDDNEFIFESPHFPSLSIKKNVYMVNYCNGDGDLLKRVNYKIPNVFMDNAYLRHYRCKTIQEYCENKIPKLIKFGYINVDFDDNFFFEINKWTEEKQNYYNNYISNNHPYFIDDSLNLEQPKDFNINYTVVSCIFGDKDKFSLHEVVVKDDNAKYILITDIDDLTSNTWEIHKYDEYDFLKQLDTMELVKYVKTHPFNFSDTEYCIYIDSSIKIQKSLNRLFYNFVNSNKSIGLMFHPDRMTITEEAFAWYKRTKDETFLQIPKLYEKENINDYILFFCSLICYKKTNKTLCILSNWYTVLKQIVSNSIFRSDQLILPAIIEQLAQSNIIKYNDIFFMCPSLVDSKYLNRYVYFIQMFQPNNISKRTLTKYKNKVIKCYNINRKQYGSSDNSMC